MKVEERRVGDVVVLDMSGRLTVQDGSERLKDKINSLLHQEARNILVNLGGVEMIDSGGLGELVSCFATVKRNHGELKLFNAGQKSQDLLTMTKLITVIDTYPNESEAIASFRTA